MSFRSVQTTRLVSNANSSFVSESTGRFAELSEKERRQRFAILIAEKQRQYLQKLSDDEELDSNSSSDVETEIQDSSSQTERNFLRTFDYVELIVGLILGLFIGLVTSINISNE